MDMPGGLGLNLGCTGFRLESLDGDWYLVFGVNCMAIPISMVNLFFNAVTANNLTYIFMCKKIMCMSRL